MEFKELLMELSAGSMAAGDCVARAMVRRARVRVEARIWAASSGSVTTRVREAVAAGVG